MESRNAFERKEPQALPDAEVLLTGNKDFLSLDMDRPKCVTVTQFLHNEGVEL